MGNDPTTRFTLHGRVEVGQGRKEPISICIFFQMHTPVAISLTCSNSLTFAHCKDVFAIVGTTFCALDIVNYTLAFAEAIWWLLPLGWRWLSVASASGR